MERKLIIDETLIDASLSAGDGIHMWQSYLPDDISKMWRELTHRERSIIVYLCEKQAAQEQYD